MSEGGWRFSYVQRVVFGDLDALQHLNNVAFLRFFETARIAYVRGLVPEHSPVEQQSRGRGFIFAECHISYRSPAFLDDEVRTYIRPADVRRSSVRLEFEMQVDSDRRVVASGYGVLVGYDYAEGRAAPLPDRVKERLEAEAAPA